MNTVVIDLQDITIQDVEVTDDSLTVDLRDGRSITVPLAWYPRLLHGTPAERKHWRLIGRGVGIHWPDLDEDLSVEGLILGRQSSESPESLQRWLDRRQKEGLSA
ncbi:MAG: DUF2442 domain-containing protein [Chloroflexi bacterium]|nr:MAG: DUF2442 domain-containing protein [Chloroflexota bacterium]